MTYVKYGNTLDPVSLDDGIRAAGKFLQWKAHALSHKLGFDYEPRPDAPNTYEDLVAAFDHSVLTKAPLPVPSTNLDDSFYLPEVTHALRFVHDVSHVMTGLTFDMHDEIQLALIQLKGFAAHGLSEHSLEYQLLYADHVGQSMCMLVTRKFVSDQSKFILDVLSYGLDEAIVREMHRGGYKAAA